MGDDTPDQGLSRRRLLGSAALVGSVAGSGYVGSGLLGKDDDPGEDGGRGASSSGAYPLLPSLDWEAATGGNVLGSPAVSGGSLYVGSYDGYVYAFGSEGDTTADGVAHRMFQFDAAGTNAPDARGPRGDVSELWRFPTDGRVAATPAVVDGTVFVGSEDNRVYALDSASGDERWRYDTGRRMGIGGSPTVVEGMVYVASGHSGNSTVTDIDESGAVHALDAASGEESWSVTYDHGVQSPPVVVDGVLYHGCQDNRSYALDAATGDVIWSQDADGAFCGNRPAVRDGTVYAGAEDGTLYALDADDGAISWQFETDDMIVSSPVVTEDGVYVGSNDHNLYSVDPTSGEERWRFETGNSVYSSPAYRDGVVYVGSLDGNLYAIDAATGERVWRLELPAGINSSPLVTAEALYFGARDDRVYCVENRSVTEAEYGDGVVTVEPESEAPEYEPDVPEPRPAPY